MTNVEDQLRHDLVTITERAQPGSIRPLRAPERRRRSSVVRWLAPVAALVAVIGIITGVSLAGRSAGNRPLSTALPPGTPKYYVTLKAVIPGNVTATVRTSATGAALASVLIAHVAPRQNYSGIWVTAAANDRVFAIGYPSRVAILRLAPNGQVERLTQLPKKISSYQVAQLSPDGTELAVPTEPAVSCGKSSPCTSGVTVLSLATGATRTWRARSAVVVQTFLTNWPAGGHGVFFYYGGHDRLLSVAGPGGSLLADSQPIASPGPLPHGWVLLSYLFTAGGNAVISSSVQPRTGKDGATTGRVLELSARTGRLLRVLYTATGHSPTPGVIPSCSLESLGPTGLHVLIKCFGFGRLDGSHFTPLPGQPARPYSGVPAAW